MRSLVRLGGSEHGLQLAQSGLARFITLRIVQPPQHISSMFGRSGHGAAVGLRHSSGDNQFGYERPARRVRGGRALSCTNRLPTCPEGAGIIRPSFHQERQILTFRRRCFSRRNCQGGSGFARDHNPRAWLPSRSLGLSKLGISRIPRVVSPSVTATTFPVKRSWAEAGTLHRTNATSARRRLIARAANSSYCPLGRSGSTGSPSWSSLGSGSSAARGLGLLLTLVGSLRATLGRLREPFRRAPAA